MKTPSLIISITILFFFIGCKDEKKYHDTSKSEVQLTNSDLINEILLFQRETDEDFKDPDKSPLADRHRKNFKGLDYFSPDTNYRVVATINRTPEAVPFLMPTTTERKSKEKVYGIAHFVLNGQSFELEVYQDQELMLEEGYEDYLFLPFTDTTNGSETYGGGRYIDLSIPEGDSLIIDFNKAYNPYCAYNPKYSCPIVPTVNHLNTAVKAGIKAFKK